MRESRVGRITRTGGTTTIRSTLLKLIVVFAVLVVGAWLGLAALIVLDGLDAAVGLPLVLLGLLAVLAVVIWTGRGGDLRDSVQRLGAPGFGRSEPTPDGPLDDPRGIFERVEPDSEEATVVPSEAPPAFWDTTTGSPAATVETATSPASWGSGPGWSDPGIPIAPVADSVERARAAADAAAAAQAARADAERRARAEERRARRTAARALRKERNRWGKLVTAVTMMTAGVLLLTDRLGRTDLGGLGVAVVCLALLTAGVLVGAWFGSARWLILPALLLAAAIAAGSFVSNALDQAAAAPPIHVAPESLPIDVGTAMEWDSGSVSVDLTETKALDGRSLALRVGRGSLTVIVPADQWVSVSSEVLVGTNGLASGVTVGDVELISSGYRELTAQPDTSAPPLYLDLQVGVGDLAVIQKAS